ncbi:MAG: hypothetical protein QXO21_00635 [Candidatus Anstonellales archaeon]
MKTRGVKIIREYDLEYQIKNNQLEIKLQMIKNAIVMISVLYLIALLLIPPYVFNKNYYQQYYYVEQPQQVDEIFVEKIPSFSDVPTLNSLVPEISLKDIRILSCKGNISTNDFYLIININDEPVPGILRFKDYSTKPYIYGELVILPVPEDIVKGSNSIVYKVRLTLEEFEGLELVCNG